jgi:hypothetical protein
MAQASSLMQFLIVVLAAWLARQQQGFIEYLKAENRMLKARLGRRRIIFTDAERRLLARHAKAVGRKKLFELDPIVSPDTLLRWHRQVIAMKWTFLRRGPGRPRLMGTIQELVVRMASENPRWGYTRIQGALSNLGHKVARGTIANILKREGIEPAPTRGERTPWSVFLRAHWRSLVAADFLTVEVWKPRGLITHYILFFYRASDASREDRGHHDQPDRSLDAPACEERRGRGGRYSGRKIAPDCRP